MNHDDRMTRRRFVVGAGLSLAATARVLAQPRRKRRSAPNIVFILADDLGALDLSCFGRPDYQTPRIDSLARDGVKLPWSYANSCTCSPTRVALISGRYQNRLAVGNYDPLIRADIGFPLDHPTLTSLLKRRGYATALIGKWHMGLLPRFGPLKSGYEEFFGHMTGAIDYFTHDIAGLGPARDAPDLFDGETPVSVEGYATDLFTARAIDFIERKQAGPFLLSLHYNAPHWPWQTRTDPGGERASGFNFEGGGAGIFAQMVAALDEGVGRVLDRLDALDLTSNTIVVFTSDNGGERFSYQWPLRGEKGTLFEGGIRVPALVRWPDRIAPGAVCDQVTMSMDWLATLIAAAGAAPDPRFPSDGIDLTPFIAGATPSLERTLFWRSGRSCAAQRGAWKYLRIDGLEYLFNLKTDVMERVNLKRRHPKEFDALKSAYAGWDTEMAPIPPDAMAVKPDQLRRMEALELPPH